MSLTYEYKLLLVVNPENLKAQSCLAQGKDQHTSRDVCCLCTARRRR